MNLALLLGLILISGFCPAQTAQIRIDDFRMGPHMRNHPPLIFDSLTFTINSIGFNALSKGAVEFPVYTSSFDTVTYVARGTSLTGKILCKFRPGYSYKLVPCVCCGGFMVIPDSAAIRGKIRFVNKTNRDLIGLRADFIYDTIPKKSKTKHLSSLVSLNCGFLPFNIQFMELDYLNPKFAYDNQKLLTRDQVRKLDEEQNKLILDQVLYMFLHGEKLTVTYDQKGEILLRFDGYMNRKEIDSFYDELGVE